MPAGIWVDEVDWDTMPVVEGGRTVGCSQSGELDPSALPFLLPDEVDHARALVAGGGSWLSGHTFPPEALTVDGTYVCSCGKRTPIANGKIVTP